MKGDVSLERIKLISQVFDKIDQDQDGIITVSEAKMNYHTRNHPDVKTGRKSEEELTAELVETIEAFKILKGEFGDPKLTRQDFLAYFRNFSAAIPDDNLFANILTSCFKLVSENPLPQGTYAGLGGKKSYDPAKKDKYGLNTPFGTCDEPVDYSKKNQNSSTVNGSSNINSQETLKAFRTKIKGRGVNGILSLGRMFRIVDDDNSRKIELNEFVKVLNENRFDLNVNDAKKLFALFDHNRDGVINYDEFVRTIVGEMNERRKNIVKRAFQKLDRNSNGVIELDDVKGVYNARNHPEVRAGKKSEDQILGEFIDTFEVQMATLVNIFIAILYHL